MPKAVAHVCSYIYVWNKSSCNGNSSLFTYDHRPFRQSCMRRQMLEEKKKKIDDKEDEKEKFFKQQKKRRKKKKCEKGKGRKIVFYFSIDNKEEMFIRSASVQATHNSLLNIQYIFHTHTIQFRHPAKSVCLTTPHLPQKKENLPYLENFQFSTSTNVFSDIILHIL